MITCSQVLSHSFSINPFVGNAAADASDDDDAPFEAPIVKSKPQALANQLGKNQFSSSICDYCHSQVSQAA